MLTRVLQAVPRRQLMIVAAIVVGAAALFVAYSWPTNRQTAVTTRPTDCPYRLYGEISQLMNQERWDEALNQSQILRELLINTPEHPLFMLNLTRMGFLAQEVGDHEREVAIWQQWLKSPHAEMDLLFKEGSLTLTDYVRTRLHEETDI
jgi:hypothetical protein